MTLTAINLWNPRPGKMKASGGGAAPTRLLIVPGLHDSAPAHWQSWLASLHHDAVRVVQDDWDTPDLVCWAARIGHTLEACGPATWVVAAHSFGCLALARHLVLRADLPVAAALLVAPADPEKFGVAAMLPHSTLPVLSTLVASDTDPWMRASQAQAWARRWGSECINLGDAGHINVDSGFGPLPLAQRWVIGTTEILARHHRLDHGLVRAEASLPA